MTWKLERTIRERTMAITRLRDALSQVYHGSLNSEDARTLIEARVYAPLKGAPRHLIAYVRGAQFALEDARYHSEIVWAHRAPDGTLYSMHKGASPAHFNDIDPLYKAGRGAEIAAWNSGAHYWNHSGKLFYSNPNK